MNMLSSSCCVVIALISLGAVVESQMQFEIPAEMLQGGYGGMQQQQQQRRQEPQLRWPRGVSKEIAEELDWLANTEWKGKTAKYGLLRDGTMESTLKECKREGACGWAANNGYLMINTPTLGVTKFEPVGSKAFKGDADAQASLNNHFEAEMKKVEWVAVKPGPAGKKSRLAFSKIMSSDEEEGMIAEDLYEVLGVDPGEDDSKIKRIYRKASIKSHPDKCKASEKAKCEETFDKLRQAYEILGDKTKRGYYNLGGMRLVRNIESGWKEVEGQKAQLDAQLNQVPANHPMRHQVEAQVRQQKAQFSEARMRPQLEEKFTSEEDTVEVPVTLEELYHGTWKKTFDYPRLVICRGCRANPNSDQCKQCGRCPPEKKQIPQFANTMFGRQVVGHKEKEVESAERCRIEPVRIDGLKVARGASPGSHMKTVNKVGHQAPGRLPGTVHFKLSYADNDKYRYAGENLYTVLTISLAEAIHGFSKQWPAVGGDRTITLNRPHARSGEVLRISKKGMFNPNAAQPYGDIIVRIEIDIPSAAKADVSKPAGNKTPQLRRDEEIEVREDGSVWRHYAEAENAPLSTAKPKARDEL
jgi:DnaJ-class molecular chaperone